MSQDLERRVYEKDGRGYSADSGNKHGPETRKLSGTLLEAGGRKRKLSGAYVEERLMEILLELVDHPTGEGACPSSNGCRSPWTPTTSGDLSSRRRLASG